MSRDAVGSTGRPWRAAAEGRTRCRRGRTPGSSVLASAASGRGEVARSSPARSPVSAACRAWWKSSLHCAVSPKPPASRGVMSARVVEVGLGDQEQRPAQRGGQARRPRWPAPPGSAGRGCPPARARRPAAARRRGSRAARPARCRSGSAATSSEPGASRLTAAPQGVWCGSVKYGPERRQVVAGRAEVVVHHVEDHAEAAAVAGVDEPLEAVRAAVGLVHGPQRRPRRSPSRAARGTGRPASARRRDAEVDAGGRAARRPRRTCRSAVKVPTCSS